MKHIRYAWLTVSALLVAAVIAGGVTYSAEAGIGSTLAKVVGKVAGMTAKTKCLNGTVVGHSQGKKIVVKYASKGKVVTANLSLTKKQSDVAFGRSIKNGTPVKVCSRDNWKSVAGNIISRVPKGLENTGYGEENGGGGGGGGGGT